MESADGILGAIPAAAQRDHQQAGTFEHYPHRPFPYFRGTPRSSVHRSTLSRNGAAGKVGAVQCKICRLIAIGNFDVHVAISWDISAQGERWTAINDQMKGALGQRSWVKPLTTYYVVRVAGEGDRHAIQNDLLAVAQSVTERVHFVISPTMASGRYDGYLPHDMWAKLNVRTD